MEDKIIVYVAGNPDAYPLEYYDTDTQTYQGVIPQLISQFNRESQYEVMYYQTDGKDSRQHLAQNLQVDILSGYVDGDEMPADVQVSTIFHTAVDGNETAYYLCFTKTAPDSLIPDMEAFFESVSQEQISGLLIETAVWQQNDTEFYVTIGALSLTIVVLVTCMILLARKYRKKLKKTQENLEADNVTGLGNLDYLTRYYHQIIHDKNRILYSLVYFYVDTDRLRRLGSSQDTDEFLRYCAVILQEYTADTDILARISDHGFVMIKLSGDINKMEDWLSPILNRIRSYTQKYAKPFDVNITSGIYFLKAEDRDLNEMIFHASQGAYNAQRDHEDYVICSDHMLQKFAEENKLQKDMEQALAKREFQLYIQFYVNVHSYQIVGGEALSRWKHHQKGLLSPNLFVPLMEREGLISKLDYYSLKEVCIFLEGLVTSGVENFFISCNVSRETFAAVDFADRCKKIMDGYRFPRELLILEITESALVKNDTQIRRNMTALKEYGVSIALDDFGEGVTSFYDLQKYPIDGIKLDKGLVDNIMTDIGKAIVKAMTQVGHEIGITVLAEGVETAEQVKLLQALHCDVAQGFYFYSPVPDWEAKNKILEQFLR